MAKQLMIVDSNKVRRDDLVRLERNGWDAIFDEDVMIAKRDF